MIRRIQIEELDNYAEQIKNIYSAAHGYSAESADFLITRIKNAEAKGLNLILLGCFQEKDLIGFVFGFGFAKGNWWEQQIAERLPVSYDWYENTFELNELAVEPRMQGKKYGEKLMRALLDEIKSKNILLGTAKHNNEHVLRFYKKLGFEIVIDNFFYEGNSYNESVIMGIRK